MTPVEVGPLMKTSARLAAAFSLLLAVPASAAPSSGCKELPDHKRLEAALAGVVADGNGGIFKPNTMWATIVDRSGEVCAVAKVGDAWPGSRVISAQKASTANAFSNDRLALSTANLYTAVQPGGSLFGLQESNPVNAAVAYKGPAKDFGTSKDPLVGERIGGVNVFGGGLALYGKGSKAVLGGLGVSGDSSCTDHIIAWRVREALGLNHIPGGVSPNKDDNIVHDFDQTGKSTGGFSHPVCSTEASELAKGLAIKSN